MGEKADASKLHDAAGISERLVALRREVVTVSGMSSDGERLVAAGDHRPTDTWKYHFSCTSTGVNARLPFLPQPVKGSAMQRVEERPERLSDTIERINKSNRSLVACWLSCRKQSIGEIRWSNAWYFFKFNIRLGKWRQLLGSILSIRVEIDRDMSSPDLQKASLMHKSAETQMEIYKLNTAEYLACAYL